MIERCKTCKYWGIYTSSACDRVGFWYQNEGMKEQPSNYFDMEVSATDDSGLDSELITGPDFGCVQWVAKCN